MLMRSPTPRPMLARRMRHAGRRVGVLLAVLVAVAVTITGAVSAPASDSPPSVAFQGDPDPTFGDGGTIRTEFSGGRSSGTAVLGASGFLRTGASAVAIDAAGRIVAAGTDCPSDPDCAFALARYLPDGTLDQSFANGGKLLGPRHDLQDPAQPFSCGAYWDVSVDSQGRILAAGQDAECSPLVARYLPDGDPDDTFGSGGFAGGPDPFPLEVIDAMSLDPTDRVVVAGSAPDPAPSGRRLAVARLNASGNPDPSFGGGDGIALGENTSASGLVIDPAGRIVVTTGAPRPVQAFDTSGTALSDFNQRASRLNLDLSPTDITVDSSGRFLLLLRDFDIAVARLTAEGNPDPSFGADGQVRHDSEGGLDSEAVDVDDRGRIAVAGTDLSARAGFVARLRANGALDRGFGDFGVADVPVLTLSDVVADPENRLVTAGCAGFFDSSADGFTCEAFGLARLVGDGPPTRHCSGSRATIVGSPRNDQLAGTRATDTIAGLAGNDTIRGRGGSDDICGGKDGDRLVGGGGGDSISGGPGGDVLVGGPGSDLLLGGPGNDTVRARGDGRDRRLNCGPGRQDEAVVDPKDPVTGCERVRRG